MTLPAIQFYHLLTTSLEEALPKLMEKAMQAEMKVVIWGKPEQVKPLSDALWNHSPNSFLAHCSNNDDMADHQPIYLTDNYENPNGADLLVIVGGASMDDYSGYTRVFDMFDGANESLVTASRKRWKFYQNAGYDLSYIKQNERGGWDKSA